MQGHFDPEAAFTAKAIAADLRVTASAIFRLRMRLHTEAGEARGLNPGDPHEGTYDSRALRIAEDHISTTVRMLEEMAI